MGRLDTRTLSFQRRPESRSDLLGRKTDRWLVKTVGVLIAVVGFVLAMSGVRRRVPMEASALAVGTAAGLAAIEIPYAAKRDISLVYLFEALGEMDIVAMWILAWRRGLRKSSATRIVRP